MYRMVMLARFYLHECHKDYFYPSDRNHPKVEFNETIKAIFFLPEQYHKRFVTFERDLILQKIFPKDYIW